MFFRQLLHDERSCASYVVGCPTMGVCAVVDPQGDPDTYLQPTKNNGLTITHIFDTHVHADHVSSARSLAELTGAKLYLGLGSGVAFAHESMHEGDVLEVGNRRIKVIETPGHTPEHVCLLVDGWFVLTGDTLFVGDVGRVDLAETAEHEDVRIRARRLHEALRKLASLPPETEVFPGHYSGSVCGRGMDGKPMSTIGREKRVNQALDLDVDDFVEFQIANLPPLPEDWQRIKEQNLGR